MESTQGRGCLFLTILSFFCLAFSGEASAFASHNSKGKKTIKVGVIIDMKPTAGDMTKICISMAVSDFYDAHPNYTTRLSLHFRDPRNDVVDAASAGEFLYKLHLSVIYKSQMRSFYMFN